jgi:hypothetical protein
MYDKENISIELIHITVFYFVPKDALTKKDDTWKDVTKKHLDNLVNFHTVQFEGDSKITYDFSPEIVIGEKNTKEYEATSTVTDSDVLIPIKEELTRRALTQGGDLYSTHKQKPKDITTRNVYLVIFEGSGAAGNGDFALVSRSYLTDESYKEEGSTFLAHEFYHTLGLLDNYTTSQFVFKDGEQIPVSILTKKDIMGQVNIPLSSTYIDIETLKKMGL